MNKTALATFLFICSGLRRLAVGHRGHISVFDLAGGMRTRVTSPPWLTFAPA
jgi:hypothetical protein